MAKKVIAAGHLALDITPIFTGKSYRHLTDVLKPGKLINTKGIELHTGGSCANTGMALHVLGADVQIAGKIGKDDFGEIVTSFLESHGVSADGLIVDENTATSYTVALVIPGIDRIFLHDPAANDTFCGEDINHMDLEGTDLFHFGYPPMMKLLYQNDGEELEKIFKVVKEKKIPISLDMVLPDPETESGKADWESILRRVLPYVDFFVPSIEEILYMVDKEKYQEITMRAAGGDFTEVLHMQEDVFPLAEKLLQMGTKIVMLKCGSAGVYLAASDAEVLTELGVQTGIDMSSWANKRIYEPCFKPTKLCSATGAGDTCIAAFLMAFLTGETAEMSVKLAAAEGACCVEAYDSVSGLMNIPQLKERIAAGWEQYYDV